MRDRKDIVVVGWHVDQTVEVLVQGLGDFAPPDSEVTIVSPEEPESLPSNCRCQHVEGSIASRQALLEVQPLHFMFFLYVRFKHLRWCIAVDLSYLT